MVCDASTKKVLYTVGSPSAKIIKYVNVGDYVTTKIALVGRRSNGGRNSHQNRGTLHNELKRRRIQVKTYKFKLQTFHPEKLHTAMIDLLCCHKIDK